jgi:hypothetical protein
MSLRYHIHSPHVSFYIVFITSVKLCVIIQPNIRTVRLVVAYIIALNEDSDSDTRRNIIKRDTGRFGGDGSEEDGIGKVRPINSSSWQDFRRVKAEAKLTQHVFILSSEVSKSRESI